MNTHELEILTCFTKMFDCLRLAGEQGLAINTNKSYDKFEVFCIHNGRVAYAKSVEELHNNLLTGNY